MLDFDEADFHHLAGLHKLKNNVRFLTGKRDAIFKEVLEGRLTFGQVVKSVYFMEMDPRLEPLTRLESFLDSNEIVFPYNEKVHKFSSIQADYLLENEYAGNAVYLFLAQRAGGLTQGCRSFFPKVNQDYTAGQPLYAHLKKEKVDTRTGWTEVQFDRLS